MVDKNEEMKGTVVIASKSFSIRAMLDRETTVFAARDLLHACGVKYPDKWMTRNAEGAFRKITAKKLYYPMMTGRGCRHVSMWFVTAEAGKKITRLTPCTADMKRWLLNDVLTYTIEPVVQYTSEQVREVPSMIIPPQDLDVQRLIDDVLFMVVELKRRMCTETSKRI